MHPDFRNEYVCEKAGNMVWNVDIYVYASTHTHRKQDQKEIHHNAHSS
jgi:hypothetical protein